MTNSFYFLIAEIAAVILFAFGTWEMHKKGWNYFFEFVMIFFYALILEELDMRFFKSYQYGDGFRMMLGQVPISIALLWAVIVSGSMMISDAAGLPETAKPFVDALLAVWMDLSLDAIAIRVGFWSWVIPMNEGWFGVPAGNLYAWMWVAFFYSIFARTLRGLYQKDHRWIWAYPAIPFICYLFLFLQLNLIGVVGRLAGFISPNQRLWIFGIHFLVFMIIAAVNWARRTKSTLAIAPIWMWSRFAIHAFFLFLFFHAGIFQSIPILGIIAVFVTVLDLAFIYKVRHA